MSQATRDNRARASHDPRSQLSEAFRSCGAAFSYAGLFSFIINLLMLTGPLFMLQIYDRVLASGSVPTLVVLTILVGGLFIFLGIFELIRSRISARMARRIDEQVHGPLFAAVIDHAIKGTPNVQAQPLRDLDTMRQFLSGPSLSTLFDLPWAPIYLAVIFLLHIYLGVFALIGAVILAIVALANDLLTRRPTSQSNESAILSHRVAEESRRNAAVIRSMGMLPAAQERWRQIHMRALQDHVTASDRNSSFSAIAKTLRLFLQSAILALGAYLAIYQEITAGTIIAASIIMARALAPIEQGISHWRAFIQFRNAHRRLKLVFEDYDQHRPRMALPAPKGRLRVEGLAMAAPGGNSMIIKDINLSLERGQALGIIGPTGAGKSTLARALANVWTPASGTVALDGAPYDQWPLETLGPAIGYLPQDVELFDGTFEDNIARLQSGSNADQVIKAAKLASVHDLILKFPDGYKTEIGESGVKLSAGQRQRIGLARALFGDPVLIIMDEPNANLDAMGDLALSQAIHSAKKRGAAVIVIAHRPSAIAAADLLLFLNEGRQVAFGPKEEVLKKVVQTSSTHSQPAVDAGRFERAHG